jgi:hypothetical protein
MALQKQSETDFAITVPNAYWRVHNVRLTKTAIEFSVSGYANTDAFPFKSLNYACAYSPVGENPFRQAYLYLKTLPEWADAVDV